MSTRSKFLLFLPTALLLLLALLMAWLLRTESGAALVWQRVNQMLDGQLQVQQLSGDLSSTLVLRGVKYSADRVIVSSPELSASLNFDLFPPTVHVSGLRSDHLQIQLRDSASDEDKGASRALTLAKLGLPLPVLFSEVRVEEFEIINTDQSESFLAGSIRLEARWHQELDIRQLQFHALDTDWDAKGALTLQSPFATEARISAQSQLMLAEDQILPLNWQAQFKGDLQQLSADLQSLQSGITVSGELRNLLNQPGWDLQLSAAALDWPPVSSPVGSADVGNAADNPESQPQTPLPGQPPMKLQGQLRNIQLSSQGKLDAFDLQAAAEITLWRDGQTLVRGTSELMGQGNRHGIHFDQLRVSGNELKLSASGQLDWDAEVAFTAQTQIDYLHPARLLPALLADWPQEHPLSGDLNLIVTAEQIGFSGLQLEITDRNTKLQGQGSYHFGDGQLAGDLGWQSLSWPLAADTAAWFSEDGQVNITGSLDDWKAAGQLHLQVSDFPQGRLQLRANGNREAADLVIDQGDLLGGQFSGSAEYQWTGRGPWSANISASQIHTGPLLPDFPAVVSGSILAKGETSARNLQLELHDVEGRVHERDFTGNGKFALQDGKISAEGLQLRSGTSRLELDGGLGPGQSLRFDARVAEFSEWWTEASGRLQARGLISLDARSPALQIDLQADDVRWGENHIASVRTRDGEDGLTLIEIASATLGERELKDIQLTFDTKPALASLQLQGQVDQTWFESRLQGQLVADQQAIISGWTGRVESLHLKQTDDAYLKLQQPVILSLSATAATLEETCLLGSRDGRICLQGEWREQGKSALSAKVQNVSLDIVRLFVHTDWTFTQRLNGSFDWQQPGQHAPSAEAQFELSAGELRFDEENTPLTTGPGVLAFQISEGNLHSGKLEIPIPGSGGMDLDFKLTQLLQGNHAQLDAALKLDLRDLSPLQQFLPYLDVIKGELSADIRIAGSLEQPQFTGYATLVRGQIEEQSSGLALSDIQMAGAIYQYDHIELNGSFRAGDGLGQLKANLQFADFVNPDFKLQLTGENLQLVDIPDMQLLANPDLNIRWQPSQLQLNGRIVIPKAQLSPRYLPASSATESPDLVIVSAEPEAEALVVSRPPSQLKITGQVEVELGKEVNLTLDRATANISGKSNFIWNNGLVPIGDGNFRVGGEVYAYGQLLSISDGRVSFPRSPANNPRLNIEAEREIFGNTQIKRAGVRVGGTLQRPTLEPFTDPMTTRERALAMLLTGSDFDYDRGVGAIEVGMYIAPKLFVSYGIGLFEDQNVISARYDLGKGLGVKATSGQRESGVDFSYTIEK